MKFPVLFLKSVAVTQITVACSDFKSVFCGFEITLLGRKLFREFHRHLHHILSCQLSGKS